MLERYVDIAAIRAAAEAQTPHWEAIRAATEAGRAIDANDVATLRKALSSTGVNALVLLISETVAAINAQLSRSSYHPAMLAIRHELDLLAKGEIVPSLYMHALAASMAEARGVEAPALASFFLPVIPALPGDGTCGPVFLAATQTHLANFNKAMLRFLKADSSAIDDIRSSLVAIENRRPQNPYFTPIVFGTAFVCAIADNTLPLSQDNKLLFSRIGALVKSAMNVSPLTDHTVASRLAFAIVHSEGEQKRVDMLTARLALAELRSQDAPTIAEFPSADMFVAAFNESAAAWQHYMDKGTGKNELIQTVDILRLISGGNSGLKKLAETFKKLVTIVTQKRYEEAKALFDHITQFMARYLDAVDSRDQATVDTVAGEEWDAASDIEKYGSTDSVRDVGVSAHVDVAREAAVDVRAAKEAFERDELLSVTELLELVAGVLKVIALKEGRDAAQMLLAHINQHAEVDAKPGISQAIDCLARYLDIAYVRPDDAHQLIEDIPERYLHIKRKAEAVEATTDREMFDIFHEEATDVVGDILCFAKPGEPIQTTTEATTLRRGFHTLKGSAAMVGLDKLAGVMAAVEHTFNDWLPSAAPYPAALATLANDAACFAQSICEGIAASGEAAFDPAHITAQLDALKR
jgi:HPt (histidine-containing phosphotransfer) domain-containing protein